MAIPLTNSQLALLNNPSRVEALARWILSTENGNVYARNLCEYLMVPRSNSPTAIQVNAVTSHLTAPNTDTGILVRLINDFVFRQRTA